MESLRSNKPLLYSIFFSFSLVLSLIFNLLPQLTEQFQIVIIPDDVSEQRSHPPFLFERTLPCLDAIDRLLRCPGRCSFSLHDRSGFGILSRSSKIKTILMSFLFFSSSVSVVSFLWKERERENARTFFVLSLNIIRARYIAEKENDDCDFISLSRRRADLERQCR